MPGIMPLYNACFVLFSDSAGVPPSSPAQCRSACWPALEATSCSGTGREWHGLNLGALPVELRSHASGMLFSAPVFWVTPITNRHLVLKIVRCTGCHVPGYIARVYSSLFNAYTLEVRATFTVLDEKEWLIVYVIYVGAACWGGNRFTSHATHACCLIFPPPCIIGMQEPWVG
jgi:hypothetical protein